MPFTTGAGLLQGPVRGTVQLPDGAQADDFVAHIHCVSHGIHGGHTADDVTRVVPAGEEFLVPWAYRGLSPIGCSLRVYHPRYVVAYHELKDDFAQQVGPLHLETWDTFLARGPADPPMHPSYPWPALEFQQHLSNLLFHYVPAFDEGPNRQALARYVPELHALFKRVLTTGAYGAWPRQNRQTPMVMIGKVEDAVSFEGSQRALFAAVSQKDAVRVAEVLKAGAFVDGWDEQGRSPLFGAARAGDTASVVALIEGGADVDLVSHPKADTPLAIALSKRHWSTAAALIAHGASLQKPGVNRIWLEQALCGVGYTGDTDSLRIFLEAGLAPDLAPRNGLTPLMCAAQGKRVETATMLIKAGADVNARASHNRTPLRLARSARSPELIELLQQAGAME